MRPIYKGTFERHDELKSDLQDETVFYKDHLIMWRKDIGRSIDYLETRNLWSIADNNRNLMFSNMMERIMGCVGIFIILVIVWRFWNVPDVFEK